MNLFRKGRFHAAFQQNGTKFCSNSQLQCLEKSFDFIERAAAVH